VISKELEDQLKFTTTPTPIPSAESPADKKNWNWLWWVGIGFGALVLLTGGDQDEVKAGLNGVGNLGKKAARKLKTIRI
jgi:hypothetical protein